VGQVVVKQENRRGAYRARPRRRPADLAARLGAGQYCRHDLATQPGHTAAGGGRSVGVGEGVGEHAAQRLAERAVEPVGHPPQQAEQVFAQGCRCRAGG
jgi:hypothetical protein